MRDFWDAFRFCMRGYGAFFCFLGFVAGKERKNQPLNARINGRRLTTGQPRIFIIKTENTRPMQDAM